MMSVINYFIIAAISFLSNFIAFDLGIEIAGLNYLAANLMGFIIGTTVNYALSACFVFKSVKHKTRFVESVLTLVVSGIGVAVETMLIAFAHDFLQAALVPAKLGAAGAVFFWNYCGRRYLVFGAVREPAFVRSVRAFTA